MQKWNGVYGKIIERCCLNKDFLPDNKWPPSWGPEIDFINSTHFVELYPPVIEVFRLNHNLKLGSSITGNNFLALKLI